jgi:uncharacterized membrane protein YgcG
MKYKKEVKNMKKVIAVMMLLGFCLIAFVHAQEAQGPFGEQILLKSALANKGLAKQLKVLEKVMYKKGAGRREISEAKMACVRMNESGLTPKEARKTLVKEIKKCLKQGIEGENLAERMQSMAQTKAQERVREGEGEKLQTREQLRDGTREEIKEKVRESRPEGKGSEGDGSGSGGDSGSGSDSGSGGRKGR